MARALSCSSAAGMSRTRIPVSATVRGPGAEYDPGSLLHPWGLFIAIAASLGSAIRAEGESGLNLPLLVSNARPGFVGPPAQGIIENGAFAPKPVEFGQESIATERDQPNAFPGSCPSLPECRGEAVPAD